MVMDAVYDFLVQWVLNPDILLPGPHEPFKRETANLTVGATEEMGGAFSQLKSDTVKCT